MIKYLNKTVFNSGCDGIVNTINCVGTMGAGLALEFALRYPTMNKEYEIDCATKKVKVGEILTYKVDDVLIVNFPTKIHWKYPSQLKWISDGLDFIKIHYKEWNINSIAIPPLGCNNGGLDFEHQVKPLIEDKLKDLEIEVCICLDPGYPEGKEKEMVDAFNLSNSRAMCEKLKIKGKSAEALMHCEHIARFYEIKNLKDIGFTTYKKIFEYFYNDGTPIKQNQLNLFDLE